MPDLLNDDYYDDYRIYQEWRRGHLLGMGYLPGVVAVAPAAGPFAPFLIGGAAIASAFLSVFGLGKDDQKTNFRAPANSAEIVIALEDGEQVSFDMNDLAQAQANGNRVDDLHSYFAAFISNSVTQGTSSAAGRVIKDAAKKYGLSISKAAALILEIAGVRKIKRLQPPPPPQPAPRPPAPPPQPPRPIQQAPAPIPPAPIPPAYAPLPMAAAGEDQETSPWVWVGLAGLALFAFTRNR